MEEDFNGNIVYSETVTDFVTVASEYCSFVENVGRFHKKDFLNKIRKILPLLYLKASLLPKVDPVFQDGNEKFVTEEDWDFIQMGVKKKLGFHNEYRDVFDPLVHEQVEQSMASISDNFADIYQDLKNFVTLYNIGTEEIMNDAVWECLLNFEEFWGYRLLSSLKAIHNVFFGEDDLEDEQEKNISENKDSDDDIDTSNWILTKRQSDYRKED